MATVKGNELLEKLQLLTFDNIEHIYRDALRDSIRPIYGETKEKLKKEFPSHSGERFLDWNKEFKWSTHWNNEAYEGKIFINPQGGLKWFEVGTTDRYRKGSVSGSHYRGKKEVKEYSRGGFTGKIKGKYVFNGIIDQNVGRILDNAVKMIERNLEMEVNK